MKNNVEMAQRSAPSNNTIYANVLPTSKVVDMGKSVVYAELTFPQKDKQNQGAPTK